MYGIFFKVDVWCEFLNLSVFWCWLVDLVLEYVGCGCWSFKEKVYYMLVDVDVLLNELFLGFLI